MKTGPGKKHPVMSGVVSLPRALSKLGYCSRTEGVKLIEDGRVRVNGTYVRDPHRRVSALRDRIEVDGRTIETSKKLLYLCMNKPAGTVTTRSDERGARTVYDVLGPQPAWIFPVGRLDKESSGLLLFTNDSAFAERLSDPASRHPKSYSVRVDRPVGDDDLAKLKRGVVLNDGYRTLPSQVKRENGDRNNTSFTITITEGKNRQIRRMCRALGYEVVELHRFAIGRLTLEDLPPGGWKSLSEDEKKRACTR